MAFTRTHTHTHTPPCSTSVSSTGLHTHTHTHTHTHSSLQHKCEQYWPADPAGSDAAAEAHARQFGELRVVSRETEQFANYTIRTFEMQRVSWAGLGRGCGWWAGAGTGHGCGVGGQSWGGGRVGGGHGRYVNRAGWRRGAVRAAWGQLA